MSSMTDTLLLLAALGLQGLVMLVDEFVFHRRRVLPRWERIGHPLDTLGFLAVFLMLGLAAPGPLSAAIVLTLMVLSCLLVTKDEWVHARLCGGGEAWLHALLFVVHPTVFFLAWQVWQQHGPQPLHLAYCALLTAWLIYQLVYWNVIEPAATSAAAVDNGLYDRLGERWYTAADDPVALLRAEARTKNPWTISIIGRAHPRREVGDLEVLDIGCGAGFLTGDLARAGYRVTGIDASGPSLTVARAHDKAGAVRYIEANAYALPFADASFDVVTCMDFLEHVEHPDRVILEAARVLRPGGAFIFHTFNRNWLAALVVIRGVEWFVKHTPPAMHVLRLFLKPEEVAALCERAGLGAPELCGIAPDPLRLAFWKLLWTREVPPDFGFRITRSTRLAYLGHAIKR